MKWPNQRLPKLRDHLIMLPSRYYIDLVCKPGKVGVLTVPLLLYLGNFIYVRIGTLLCTYMYICTYACIYIDTKTSYTLKPHLVYIPSRAMGQL